jgi:hypothetical protein
MIVFMSSASYIGRNFRVKKQPSPLFRRLAKDEQI